MTTSACKILLKNKNKKQNRKLYEPKKKPQKQRILLSHDIEKHPLGDK